MSTTKPAEIAIVGGGISGLATAYFLQQAITTHPLKMDLFESNDRLGGKIFTQRENGLTLELGAESLLSRKRHGVGMCDALGIRPSLRGTRPEKKKTFVWWQGRLHRLPEGLSGFVPGKLSALRSATMLSLPAKLRVALDLVLPPRNGDDDESLGNFISRRLGKQAFERLVQPLLGGIYCADGHQLSLAATYPELRQLEKKHGSLIRGLRKRTRQLASDDSALPPFVTLAGGMSELIDTLKSQLQSTHFHLGHPIDAIEYRDDKLVFGDREFDAVVLATSSLVASKILAKMNPALSDELSRIPHVSTATINLWYRSTTFDHDLDGYGFVIPSAEQNGITAVTWTSSKHYDRSNDEMKLIRVYAGRAGNEIESTTTDEAILEIVKRELRRTMGVRVEPDGYVIQRWPGGSPQYTLNHLERLERIDRHCQKVPGLFLCGASYRGVGIPDCIRQAEQTANSIGQFVASSVFEKV